MLAGQDEDEDETESECRQDGRADRDDCDDDECLIYRKICLYVFYDGGDDDDGVFCM